MLINEIFNKQYRDFNNISETELLEIKNAIIEVNELFYNREIVKGCRVAKGVLEDCLNFICQNYSNNSLIITFNTMTKDFYNFLRQYSNGVFSIINEEVANEWIKKIYTYISKIDHYTKLKTIMKDIQRKAVLKNIEYSFCALTKFMILLLFDFKFSRDNINGEFVLQNDELFIIENMLVIDLIISLSFLYNFDREECFKLNLELNLNSNDDKYLNNLIEWNNEILAKNEPLTDDEIITLKKLLNNYEDELYKRGYKKYNYDII